MKKSRVIGLSGSHRREGNTHYALHTVLQTINEKNISTELLALKDYIIEPCRACDTCRTTKVCAIKDDFQGVYQKIEAAEGLIFGSPVYTFAPTPLLLSLRTRLSRLAHCRGEEVHYQSSKDYVKTYPHPSALRRKVGGSIVLARRAGADSVLSMLNTFFMVHEMFIVGAGYLTVAFGYEKGSVKEDREGISNLARFGENFAWLVESIYGQRN